MDYNTRKLLEIVAKENNTSPEEVYNEIEASISFAYENPDPSAQLMWAGIPCAGERPTVEEVLVALAHQAMGTE